MKVTLFPTRMLLHQRNLPRLRHFLATALCLALVFSGVIPPGRVLAQATPPSLKDVPVPVPRAAVIVGPIPGPQVNLNFQLLNAQIVKNQAALIRLGKALFWDMQVGSDGVQACASCHFAAGGDTRSRNQISPGVLDQNFQLGPIGGDNSFGNSTVPFTANDPNTFNPPGPSEPPPANLNVPGIPRLRPNVQLRRADFPFYQWFPTTEIVPRGPGVTFAEEFFTVDKDTNDIVSSMGVRRTQFVAVTPGQAVDQGIPLADIFNVVTPGQLNLNGRVRRVEPRNTPTTINAVFNFDNFWDGRASFIFNGVNPFGFRDRTSTLKQNINGVLTDVFIRVTNSSLASQAVGPPLSDFEMSWAGRSFPDVGKKMVSLRPLAKQTVHPQDSVLGPFVNNNPRLGPLGKGLRFANYAVMIRAAFQDQWWNSTDIITVATATAAVQQPSANNPRTMVVSPGQATVNPQGVTAAALAANQYTQMEYNFSLFWGLAVQAYERTLIANDTPFDRFMGSPTQGIPPDPNALTPQEQRGLDIFLSRDGAPNGRCNNCHRVPEFTNHSIRNVAPNVQGVPLNIIEDMVMGDGIIASYDNGFYNISVRRTTEDISRAGTAPNAAPFLNPLDANNPFPLSYVALAALRFQQKLPPDVARFVPNHVPFPRLAINGNFKASSLRNIEFNGPYFHSGQMATLRQAVEFYVRGGNFPNTNFHDLDIDIDGIPELVNPFLIPQAKADVEALVAFLANGLTDPRVAFERAPFDHPELILPNGSPNNAPNDDLTLTIPAVGAGGRATPINRFLNLDPQDPGPF
jgi:cytochrome c peroxidase